MSKYIIINNPNEIAVNNAYNELKNLYKSVYRSNDLLAYKLLVNTINEGILSEISNESTDHLVLIDTIRSISYANDKLKELDIYPNDIMFDNDHVVDMNQTTESISNVLSSSEISFTAAHANGCISINALIDDEINKMFIYNSNFANKEQELLNIISTTLAEDSKIDASKYDVSTLEPTLNYNNKAVNKIYNKIIALLSKKPVIIPTGKTYIINIGGLNADQININNLATEINRLYAQLYNIDEYSAASTLANQYYQFISSWSEGTPKNETLANAGLSEDEINSLGELDNDYVYTAEDITAIEGYKNNQEAAQQQIEDSNNTVQSRLETAISEYNAAVAAYPTNHNGSEYSGTIIESEHKHMKDEDNYLDEIKTIIAKHNEIEPVIPISEITVDQNDITATAGESVQINLSYEPSNYTPFDASEITVETEANISIDEVTVDHITVTPSESGTIIITINGVSASVTINVESQPQQAYYFGVSHDPIISNGVIDFSGFNQYTEDEFFDNNNGTYKYHAVTGIDNYETDSIRYILIPNEYQNNISIMSPVEGSVWDIEHAYTDGQYTVLDATNYTQGLGFTANFKLKLGGNPFSNDAVIETLTPEEPAETYYWYVGQTPVDDTNYTSISSSVTEIPTSTDVTLNTDDYLYIVAPKTKTVTVLDANTQGIVNIKTYNSETHTFTYAETFVDDYKIYKSAQPCVGPFIINISDTNI